RGSFCVLRSASQTMATKSPILGLLLLFAVPRVLTSPISQIRTPDVGVLSFAELAQQTFRQILELGFLRGVLASLMVLGCLVCLLICILSGLATYLRRNETQLWDKPDGIQQHSAQEKMQIYSRDEGSSQFPEQTRHLRRPKSRSRIIQYLFRHHFSPVAKINIRTSSSLRKATSLPLPPSSSSRSPGTTSSPPSPSTPLRSALSKSPPPPRRFSKAQFFLFRTARSSLSPSPKSVRWADQLQVAVMADIEMNIQSLDPEFETDIGL
ncbi:hypothetical protein A1O3_10519, partial [Capronia epimyces CBS 606.96]